MIEAVMSSRISRTVPATFLDVNRRGSQSAATAALFSRKLPLLHSHISLRRKSMSASPTLWSAIATASLILHRGSDANPWSCGRYSFLPLLIRVPSPTTPQKVKNTLAELVGASSGFMDRYFLIFSSSPISAKAWANSRFPLGPGKPDSFRR